MQPEQLPLKDIHIPADIGWWPPAIGWWLLVILIPLAMALVYWLYQRMTRKTAIKTAQILLTDIKSNFGDDTGRQLRELSVLMRRVAISVVARQNVASLVGKDWLEFLDEKSTGTLFQQGIGQLLAEAPYSQYQPSAAEMSQLISLCEDWLKNCTKRKP
ncbi:MAG: DUF4381 domain-containing protein [Methylococcales bacterium]